MADDHKTRPEYWDAVMDLTRSKLRGVIHHAGEACKIMSRAERDEVHLLLGYPTHEAMLEGEGIADAFTKAVATVEENDVLAEPVDPWEVSK